jgi:hypothetical protein
VVALRMFYRWKDSTDSQWKSEPLEPLELIRRWLLHVLPKGFVAVRHFGWLSAAAGRALRRVALSFGPRPSDQTNPPYFTVASAPVARGQCVSPDVSGRCAVRR